MPVENVAIPGNEAATSPKWNSRLLRRSAYQLGALSAVALLFGLVTHNIWVNLKAAGIGVGFDFLLQPASFDVPDSLLGFPPGSSIGRAFLVGTVNTVVVSALGVVLASIFGLIIGLSALAAARLVSSAARSYVELIRNTPLLLQLLFWHTLLTHALPVPAAAIRPLPCVFLTNRGLFMPEPSGTSVAIALAAAGAALGLVWRVGGRSGKLPAAAAVGLLASAAVLWLTSGAGGEADATCPQLHRFNIVGGWQLTPEFVALLLSLSLYTAAFVAEILRGAILAIPGGQDEAARALGLPRALVLRLVIVPQALRAMIPPLASQYLNLLKSSSLAVAVAFPDLVRVATISISQTGRAIECMFIMIAIYLLISLAASCGMNLYNRRQLRKGL